MRVEMVPCRSVLKINPDVSFVGALSYVGFYLHGVHISSAHRSFVPWPQARDVPSSCIDQMAFGLFASQQQVLFLICAAILLKKVKA